MKTINKYLIIGGFLLPNVVFSQFSSGFYIKPKIEIKANMTNNSNLSGANPNSYKDLSGPLAIFTDNRVQNPHVDVRNYSFFFPQRTVFFWLNMGVPIQKNRAFLEVEAGLDMTGSRVAYNLNMYQDLGGEDFYFSESIPDDSFLSTLRFGVNYMYQVNKSKTLPLFLQTGVGFYWVRPEWFSHKSDYETSPRYAISPTQEIAFSHEYVIYYGTNMYINFGVAADIHSSEEKYLFTLAATGYFGFNSRFSVSAYSIEVFDSSSNEVDTYIWNSVTRGGGIVFQLSRRFGFTKNQE